MSSETLNNWKTVSKRRRKWKMWIWIWPDGDHGLDRELRKRRDAGTLCWKPERRRGRTARGTDSSSRKASLLQRYSGFLLKIFFVNIWLRINEIWINNKLKKFFETKKNFLVRNCVNIIFWNFSQFFYLIIFFISSFYIITHFIE